MTPKGSTGDRSPARTGARLATAFWESVLAGGRIRGRDVLAGSPLEALLRLYGSRGAALAVGLRDAEDPIAVSTSTFPDVADGASDGRFTTAGDLQTSAGRAVPFALRWRSAAAVSLVELEVFPLSSLGPLLVGPDDLAARVRVRLADVIRRPPPPVLALDPVPAELLDRSATFAGLGYGARCIAAHWYLGARSASGRRPVSPGDETGAGGAAPGAHGPTIAAVEATVGRRAGMRLTAAAVADRYGCRVQAVRDEVRRLQVLVRSCDYGW